MESYPKGAPASTSNVRDAALHALACGLSILPPRQDGTKAPMSPGGEWKWYQENRASLDQLHAWYGTKGTPKLTGLGTVCGAVSGNLECLEFDAEGRTYDAFKAAAVALNLGDLVERIEAGYLERSPSGGIHWLYRCETIAGSTKLAQYESGELDGNGKPIVKPLIETKGEGGYIILAPTNGRVHPSRGAYELLRGGFDSIATITPQERLSLWALARSFDETPHAELPGKAEARCRKEHAAGWGDGDVVSPLDDYNARSDWPDILPAGWKPVYRRGDTEYWCRPGKAKGVSATINRDGSDRLFVFSTSAGFEAEKPYSKFAAYALLNHGNDFTAAFHALSRAGYGTFKAWVWEGGKWELRTLPNPCPKGGHVRIARPGEKPPARPPKGVKVDAADPSVDLEPEAPLEDDQGLDLGLGKRPRTDLGNAERLVARHGHDLRYCHPWSKWLVWDGRRWSLDQTGAARRRARNTVRAIGREASAQADPEKRKAMLLWGLTSEKRDKISAMLHLAEAEEGIPVLPERLNADPWSFNCRNGTIDLRTGELRHHRREDLITQICPVDYDAAAQCPLWLETLDLFLDRGDASVKAELLDYFQRLCGYAMAGVVRDHIMPVAYGTGSNGKSTILGTLMDVFGADYAMKCPPDMLMAKRTDSHPTDRADLFGKRLVVAIETEAGRRLNETMVKELTGGDRIRARRMREDFWEFEPTHTLIMATNHKPVVRGTDHGVWRRLKLLGFTVSLGDDVADKAMPEKLRREHRGILAWCVRGCLAWQERGLAAPDDVTEATAGYRREQDLLGAFLDECTLSGRQYRAKASELYARYKAWGEAGGEFVVTNTAFSLALQERGFERERSNGTWYLGLGLADSGDTTSGEASL